MPDKKRKINVIMYQDDNDRWRVAVHIEGGAIISLNPGDGIQAGLWLEVGRGSQRFLSAAAVECVIALCAVADDAAIKEVGKQLHDLSILAEQSQAALDSQNGVVTVFTVSKSRQALQQ